METSYVKEVKRNFRGNLLNYMSFLEKEKSGSAQSTASLYKVTLGHLERFVGTDILKMKQVNPLLVKDFVSYLQSLNLSPNSVTNYTSIFRTVFNSAVSESLVTPETNPFQKIHLRPVSTYKRSVGIQVIKDMTELDLKGKKRLDFARDLFLFSFMACGMAFVDLAHLTRNNVRGNVLVYYRVKTKTEIRVTITSGMRRLLEKYARENSNLLFPVLQSEEVSYERYKVALRTYNRRLATIGDMIDCPVKLTSYVARHSWAMQAKENSVSVAVISQALGHTSERTTLFYLKELDQNIIDRVNLKIIDFVEKWVSKRSYKN